MTKLRSIREENMDWIQFKVIALSYFIGWMVAIATKKSQ